MRVTPKDRARVERILEAVGTKFVRPQLDKDALGNRLNFAASLYAGKVQGKYQRDHGKILKEANDLYLNLSAFPGLSTVPGGEKLLEALDRMLGFKPPDERVRVDRILKKATLLQKSLAISHVRQSIPVGEDVFEALNETLSEWTNPTRRQALAQAEQGTRQTLSPKEWLAGVRLPRIFQEFFARPSGRSWRRGEAHGPCVRFIHAAMHEMNLEFSNKSIVRAMTTARTSPGTRRRR
jgi:hypothetical protein